MTQTVRQGVARYQAGQVEVLCLTDGATRFDSDVFPQIGADARKALLDAAGLDGIDTSFNAYALRLPDGSVTLVDTGCGAAYGDSAGRFGDLLQVCGIAPADVTRILFTHLHSDHCGGALAGDGLVFPEAEVLLHPAEEAHWRGSDAVAGQLLARVPQVTHVAGGDDLGHGITVWELPGHTPGHIGVRLDGLCLVGDVIHSEALQLPEPEQGPIYDMDPAAARESRLAALGHVADAGLVWSGSHMLGPDKFARLQRDGLGFRRIAL